MRYDFQNIIYSPKNRYRTKNITTDYNNDNRLELNTFFCSNNFPGVWIIAKHIIAKNKYE